MATTFTGCCILYFIKTVHRLSIMDMSRSTPQLQEPSAGSAGENTAKSLSGYIRNAAGSWTARCQCSNTGDACRAAMPAAAPQEVKGE